MHELTNMIQRDMLPAFGVTEPGAIAFSVAKARTYAPDTLKHVHVAMNSGLYKNAFTCGIPHSDQSGIAFAAALGYVAGDASRGLESLACVPDDAQKEAHALIDQGKISFELSGITSRIYLQATVESEQHKAIVTIQDSHTNITRIEVDGQVVFQQDTTDSTSDASQAEHLIHRYTLADLVAYVQSVPAEEIAFVNKAYETNLALFEEGLHHPRAAFSKVLLELNGSQVISSNEKTTASLLCNAAIEARVLGLDKPAMSITGSGAHGIIATMPLYAMYRIHNLPEELLHRATMLSYLVCTYIKEYSGKLSAFCGCAIAAGTGMACGLCLLKGGSVREMTYAINNMAASITGMICDGGNHGCTMKGVAACETAFAAVEFAMRGVCIAPEHGINGPAPEDTMRNMGLIASPGMVHTEKTIVDIMEHKKAGC